MKKEQQEARNRLLKDGETVGRVLAKLPKNQFRKEVVEELFGCKEVGTDKEKEKEQDKENGTTVLCVETAKGGFNLVSNSEVLSSLCHAVHCSVKGGYCQTEVKAVVKGRALHMLPMDALAQISTFLDIRSLYRLLSTSKFFFSLLLNETFWMDVSHLKLSGASPSLLADSKKLSVIIHRLKHVKSIDLSQVQNASQVLLLIAQICRRIEVRIVVIWHCKLHMY